MSRDLTPSGRSRNVPDQAGYKIIAAQRHAGFFACDRILFLYRPIIHALHSWAINAEGVVGGEAAPGLHSQHNRLQTQLVALKADLTPATTDDEQAIIVSACEVAKHLEGPVAERLVRILYRMANDPPYWRHPHITLDLSTLMDDLGYARDSRGYHVAENRARVRAILLAFSRVEIRGERFDGRGDRETYQAPLIYVRGARCRGEERGHLDFSHTLEEGLPASLDLELGWYEGVRRADGVLGNNYVLLPSDLGVFRGAESADKAATEERLLELFWMRHSLTRGRSSTLPSTMRVALSHAGITRANA